MSNFAQCPTPDNDDEEEVHEESHGVEEGYLDFKGEEEEYTPRMNINVSPTSVFSEDIANFSH